MNLRTLKSRRARLRRLPTPALFLLAALAAELVDELVDGTTGAAWPSLRSDLSLNYVQVGLLLGIPAVFANLLEPALGFLADAGRRRWLIVGGGLCFAAALLLVAAATGFWPLLLALLLFYPASGAFVSLTQAALMDADPARHEQNMARWALAGSVGNLGGPLLVSLAAALGGGWRPVFVGLAGLALVALALLWSVRAQLDPSVQSSPDSSVSGPFSNPLPDTFWAGWQGLRAALSRSQIRRSLLLLECADLMLDIFRGFVALYFVDAVGASAAQAGLAVIVLTGVGLIGDVLIVPVLERVSGVAYVRLSAAGVAVTFAAFLMVPQMGVKLALLGVLGLLTSGWYAVLQARLYTLLPAQSGTVMALGSISAVLAGLVPIALGGLAQQFGVQVALWALLLGPLALLLGLPRASLKRE
ncbi:MFS transporter [Deinococcus aquatilis]|jgi:FSR family fosmidomycin resistance protein-like MFS transporter|uniref:MFS transporter n=1 Tax=Deinococcus aquatilis TaxID=519440 RepID=UPI00037E1DE8|nr:MFS transporter [Deinococcus aquatilis]